MAQTTDTKAAIAAKFLDAAGNGGNGATTPPGENAGEETVNVAQANAGIGLPPVIEEPPAPSATQMAATVFGKKPIKTPAPPASATARLHRVLPEAHRIKLYKRLPTGASMYIDEYAPSDIMSGGGSVESFTRRHLKAWLDPGVNYIRIKTIDNTGQEHDHGEIPVAGDTPFATPTVQPTAGIPLQDRDPLADIERVEAHAAHRRAEAKAELEAQVEREKQLREALLKESGGSPMNALLAALLPQMMRPQAPPRDLRDEADFIDRRIEKALSPIINDVTRSQTAIAERLERLAQLQTSSPAAQPPAAPDPLIAVTKLLEVVKPPAPTGPSPAEIEVMIQRSIAAAVPQRRDEITMKDYIDMKEREADRLARERERLENAAREERNRLEAAMERRIAELKGDRPKDGVQSAIETVKAIREATGLFGGGENPGLAERAIDAAVNPDFWEGLSGFVESVRSRGESEEGEQEDEDENRGVKVPERSAPTQSSTAHESKPHAQRQRTKSAPVPAVKPEDLAINDYPEGLAVPLEQLSQLSQTEATDEAGAQKQLVAVMMCLDYCRQHHPAWKKRVEYGFNQVLFGGANAVKAWIVPFVRGLARNGKLTLPQIETLQKNVETNAEWIAKTLRAQVRRAKAAKAKQPLRTP